MWDESLTRTRGGREEVEKGRTSCFYLLPSPLLAFIGRRRRLFFPYYFSLATGAEEEEEEEREEEEEEEEEEKEKEKEKEKEWDGRMDELRSHFPLLLSSPSFSSPSPFYLLGFLANHQQRS